MLTINQYLPNKPVSSCLSLIKDGFGILHWSRHCHMLSLYITPLQLPNKQHHLFARSQFVQHNKSIMYHPNFIRLPSVLVAGGRLQLLQTRLQLGQPLLSQVDRVGRGKFGPKGGGVWPGTFFFKPMASTAFASVMISCDIRLHALVFSELAQLVTLHVCAQRVLGIFSAAQSFLHRAIGHGLMHARLDGS